MLLPFKPTTHIFKIGRALTNTETDSLYSLARMHKVGICLWQDTPPLIVLPRHGVPAGRCAT